MTFNFRSHIMRLLSVYLGLTFLMLAGCSHLPRIEFETVNAKIEDETQKEVSDLPAYWQSIGSQTQPSSLGWVYHLRDPLLKDYIQTALQNNRNLIIAEANIRRAEAVALQARAGLRPSVNYSVGASRGGLINNKNSVMAEIKPGLSASWEPDLWGRIKSGEYIARANIEAAKADYLAAQQSIAASVCRLYFQIIEAKVKTQIAQNTVTALSENMRIVTAQYQDGAVSGQEPALTGSDLATARQTILAAQNAVTQLTRALEILLNKYPDNQLQTAQIFPPLPSNINAEMPASLLDNRPDIVAAERGIATAFYSLEQAKVAHLPNLSVSGSLGSAANSLIKALDPDYLAWSLAGNIFGPLYDAGVLKANVAIAETAQLQALANYRTVVLGAVLEVETALTTLTSLKAQEAELALAHEQASEALKIANIRYQAGEISLVDVLSIQQRTFQTESNLASTRAQILTRYVDLNLALGGHWQ